MNQNTRRASAAALAAAGVLTFSGGFALMAGSADAAPSVVAASGYPTETPSTPGYPTETPSTPTYPTETPSTPTYPTETPSTPTETPSTPTTPSSPATSPSGVSPTSASPSTTHHHGVKGTTKSPATVPTVIDSGLASTSGTADSGQEVLARGLLTSGALLVLGSLLYVVGLRRRAAGQR